MVRVSADERENAGTLRDVDLARQVKKGPTRRPIGRASIPIAPAQCSEGSERSQRVTGFLPRAPTIHVASGQGVFLRSILTAVMIVEQQALFVSHFSVNQSWRCLSPRAVHLLRLTKESRPSALTLFCAASNRARKDAHILEKVVERFQPTIGVEVHVQILCKTKAFCSCRVKQGASVNTHICPVCLGHPGTLPSVNRAHVTLAAKAGIALHCRIANNTKFDRKNYFYPDTPKNYQISQYDVPLASDGYVMLPISGKRVSIQRAHMEEDSAKMIHAGDGSLSDSSHSLIDHNRAGVALVEVVSGPDMCSGSEASELGEELQRIFRYAGISDGNMQDGSLRLDVNVSIRPRDGNVTSQGSTQPFGTKVELKNLNSFNAVERAIDYEIIRQSKLLDAGETVRQETRLWNERDQVTKLMRIKEGAADYRYFPEPDLPRLRISDQMIQQWASELPELPAEKRERYASTYRLSAYDARVLTADRATAEFFERVVDVLHSSNADEAHQAALAKAAANWIAGDIAAQTKSMRGVQSLWDTQLRPETLAEMILLIEDGTISGKIGKDLLPELLQTQCSSVSEMVRAKGLVRVTDTDTIRRFLREVMQENPDSVAAYLNGKTKLAGFFVGQIMKKSGGVADPVITNRVVSEVLASPGKV